MQTFLKVPIRIEGLYLPTDRMVTSPLADFTRLPWTDGKEDYHVEQPFFGDGIVHHAFQDENLLLRAGIHLHFILPHYLGQPLTKLAGIEHPGNLPPAPNRWLITRRTTLSSGETATTQWVVESDHVHGLEYDPMNPDRNDEPTCVIPVHEARPYRYMGRKTLLTSDYQSTTSSSNNFQAFNAAGKPLTVAGYGDIHFSAFYPDCLGVFGFFDPLQAPASSLVYSIVGWNASANEDLLANYLAKVRADPTLTAAQLQTLLRNTFKLESDLDPKTLETPRSVFFGEINMDAPTAQAKPPLSVFIGNTGTEALSALLADALSVPGQPATKAVIEDQLEAMALFAKLDHLALDTGPKFLEARHEKGFKSMHSGHLWRIVEQHQGSVAGPSDDQALPAISDELAGLLNTLNVKQRNYDAGNHGIRELRRQLYIDWFKYMQANYPPLEGRGQYPDADHIRYFIGKSSVPELSRLIAATGKLQYGNAASGFRPQAPEAGQQPAGLAGQVSEAWAAANTSLADLNNDRSAKNQPLLTLAMIAGPRYWESNAPSILVSGLPADALVPGDLTISAFSSTQTLDAAGISSAAASDLLAAWGAVNPPQLSTQQWNPFLMDWQVDLTDLDLQNTGGAYRPDALEQSFTLDAYGPDFEPETCTPGNRSVFSGTVILSAHAADTLQKNIVSFVDKSFIQSGIPFLPTFNALAFLTETNWTTALAMLNLSTLSAAKKTATESTDYASNPLYTAWTAYGKLVQTNVLSQTLNGFNQACVMKRKTSQLPVKEPIGFNWQQEFSAAIKEYVHGENDMSPITAYDFNVIRSGGMSLNALSLIDNFGLTHDIDNSVLEALVPSETLSDGSGGFFLKPRLAQPARLNFRWLSARQPLSNVDDSGNPSETNAHPASSPVCGWVMPNFLDNTLGVYASDGSALGFLDANASWNTLPWSGTVVNLPANIANPYLLNTIQWLASTFTAPGNSWNDFLDALRTGLDNIAPAHSPVFDSRAILMGRPMAVVRSRVSFMVKGLPVISQSWPALLSDLVNCDEQPGYGYAQRYNRNWTSVKLPLRLGEHSQLNDGLVGYWIEGSTGSLAQPFIAPETPAITPTTGTASTPVLGYGSGNFQTQWLSINDAPVTMTMLVDPRGLVHATTGVLPVKAISIPPQYYLPALKKIAMWFSSSPLLQPELAEKAQQVLASLPEVQGYAWQWWDPFNGSIAVNPASTGQKLTTPNRLIDGWLMLTPSK